MSTTEWKSPKAETPDEGTIVDWIAPGGDQIAGGQKGPGQLWFLPPDHKVYCYYEPAFWRIAQPEPTPPDPEETMNTQRWKDIETAPKDGTHIMTWSLADGVLSLRFLDKAWRPRRGVVIPYYPTLWMPFPKPPWVPKLGVIPPPMEKQ